MITVASRRPALKAGAAVATAPIALASSSAAAVERSAPDGVEITYNESVIKKYQPSLVLQDVEPDPLAFHALHATADDSSLNAVYGFVQYPYQSGVSSQDSHLGDHEPIITWYDPADEETVRVDFAAYHWFRSHVSEAAIETVSDARERPVMRVDPTYHHYYQPEPGVVGERLEVADLTESIDDWLDAGLESELAISQPYDPWQMLSRESWWRHTTRNWLDALAKATWYNVGLSGARGTAEPEEVSAW